MFSYLDLSLTLVFCGALVLLVLILVSFLLCSKRASATEERLELLEKAESELQQQNEQLRTKLEEAEKKVKLLEQSNAYLSDQAQQSVDKLQSLNSTIEELQAKFASATERCEQLSQKIAELKVQPKTTESANSSLEHKALTDAKELLKQGFDENEVSLQTGLPAGEVDMISRMLAPAPDSEKTAVVIPPKIQTSAVSTEPIRHRKASLQARNAYGIGSSLRRQR